MQNRSITKMMSLVFFMYKQTLEMIKLFFVLFSQSIDGTSQLLISKWKCWEITQTLEKRNQNIQGITFFFNLFLGFGKLWVSTYFKGHTRTFHQSSKHKILLIIRKLRIAIYLCVFSTHQMTLFLSPIQSSKRVLFSWDGDGGVRVISYPC